METNYPKHIVVVAALVRDACEQVLLVRHHRRGWEIPQGKVEEGEGLVEALQREVLEESGITVEAGQLAAIWSKISPPQALILGFLSRYRSGELAASDECPEVGWFSADRALEMVANPASQDRLRTLLDFNGKILCRTYTPRPYRVLREDALGGQ